MTNPISSPLLGRRAFLKNGTLLIAAASAGNVDLWGQDQKPHNDEIRLRVGLMTDLHYADKPSRGSRHYRETLTKLEEAARQFEKDHPSMVVELGDLVDAADSVDVELSYLKTINREFSALCEDRHYVLGNHCVDTLTKQEFLDAVERPQSYYSFDRSGVHFIVLDACYRSDGEPYGRKNFQWTDPNIPPAELEWLKADLADADKPVIVLAHQRLDVTNNHGIKNCLEVRAILEASGKVQAVFQGHSHVNALTEINRIPYCTLVGMIEGTGPDNNGYALLDVLTDGRLRVTGFRKQKHYDWPKHG